MKTLSFLKNISSISNAKKRNRAISFFLSCMILVTFTASSTVNVWSDEYSSENPDTENEAEIYANYYDMQELYDEENEENVGTDERILKIEEIDEDENLIGESEKNIQRESETESFAGKDDGLKNLSFKLHPAKESSIVLEGLMPEGATVTAKDVTDSLTDGLEKSDKKESDEIISDAQISEIACAFDITIHDGNEEFQPDEIRPIYVEITDESIADGNVINILHIKDDGTTEEIDNFAVSEGRVSFYATGFSVYAIVTDEDVVPTDTNGKGWLKITDVAELDDFGEGSDGVLISSLENFFMTSESYSPGGTRKGVKKTKPATSDPNEAIDLGAVPYFFIKEDTNKYKIYCIISGVKTYLQQNANSLNMVTDEGAATVFDIENFKNTNNVIQPNIFYAKSDTNNFCINQQGSSAGNGFCTYGGVTDNNAKLVFWYYVPIDDDPYKLNGKTYGLGNMITVSTGNALMADDTDNTMSLCDVTVRTSEGKNTVYVTDADISKWTFENTSEDKYKISTVINGVTKYIKISESGVLFVTEGEASEIKVTAGTGTRSGAIKLSSGGYTLCYVEGSGFTSEKAGADNSKYWLNFLDDSSLSKEDYVTYSANKISVSEAVNGQQVIVYTRVWDNQNKKYDFYAIDHDGKLVQVYERGDDIMWVGNAINTLLWDFTEYYYEGTTTPNNYYELYNSYSRKYLAPQIGAETVLSDKTIGINMPGRKDEAYYTDILAWDDNYYAYAGIKADLSSESIAPCSRSQSGTFYFAVMSPTADALTPIETINNDDYGITMKMYDFDSKESMNDFLGNTTYNSSNATVNILSTDLKENGYPYVTANGNSLGDMSGIEECKEIWNNVNHLFLKSTYEASGYFEYDSCQNFATLIETNDGNFTVYKELGTTDKESKTTLKHGQFFPFDTITAGKYSTLNPENLYSAMANAGNANIGELSEDDPRKYEKLYTVGNNPNYYNLMEMHASFVQTPSGKDAWGHDIIFEFTGDDDFWLYVDGELVLDLGGIHSALAGNVNFATGDVYVNGKNTNLREIFKNNYTSRNPLATDEEINSYLNQYFAPGENIFKDYSAHNMSIFYMERGGGASNLHMRFNLSYVTQGSVMLSKDVTGAEDLDFDLVQYPYQIYYKDEENGEEKLLGNDDQFVRVTYQNSTKKVEFAQSYMPLNGTTAYQNVYFLSPGNIAEIHFPSGTIEYKIVECAINTEVYDHVYVNGEEITGTSIGNVNRMKYESDWRAVEDRKEVAFENHVDPDGLRTLSIKKNLYDENADKDNLSGDNLLTREEDNTTFSFRLYLTNGVSNNLELANMVKYHVRDEEGNLCKWDAASKRFETIGKSDYNLLSDTEKEMVTFESSMNGSISKIPAGFTIEVPNLPVDTKFKLEERDYELPLGYTLLGYDREQGTYHAEDGAYNAGTVRANESPFMYVNNKRGVGLSVNKIWTDKDFSKSHEAIYTAVLVKGELKSGSIRKLTYPTTSIRYYFDNLESGCTIDDLEIVEVKIKDGAEVSVDEEGVVTVDDSDVVIINDGDPIVLGAISNNQDDYVDFSYIVSYDKGEATATGRPDVNDADDNNGGDNGSNSENANIMNVRSDTITNTRGGGVVITLYKWNSDEKLEGGTFVLTKDGNPIGTYVSDEKGRVTILYEFDRNEEYTLTEISAPSGYIGLPNPLVFVIDESDNITVTGNETGWSKGEKVENTSDSDLIAYVDVYNKPFTFKVRKYDGSADNPSDKPLLGVHFSLHRSVPMGIGGGTMKNYVPMIGYEDLETDVDGFIPGIDENLEAGTYYLQEDSTLPQYEGIEKDVMFSITPLGVVTVDSYGHSEYLQMDENEEGVAYIINVPNTRMSGELIVRKIVEGNMGNKDKEFEFTIEVAGAQNTDEYIWTKNGTEQIVPLHTGDKFTLKHNEEVSIILPMNVDITITEESIDYASYFKLNDEDKEKISSKTFALVTDGVLLVTNTRKAVIPTGVRYGFLSIIMLGLVSAVGYRVVRRGYKREDLDDEDIPDGFDNLKGFKNLEAFKKYITRKKLLEARVLDAEHRDFLEFVEFIEY